MAQACGHHQSRAGEQAGRRAGNCQILMTVKLSFCHCLLCYSKVFFASLIDKFTCTQPGSHRSPSFYAHAQSVLSCLRVFSYAIVLCLLLGHFCYGFVSKLWPLPFLLPLSNKLNPHMLWASVCPSV